METFSVNYSIQLIGESLTVLADTINGMPDGPSRAHLLGIYDDLNRSYERLIDYDEL